MNFEFLQTVPAEFHGPVRLISGAGSSSFSGIEYVITAKNESEISIFEIRYEYHCSPFKGAMIEDNVLAVGHEEFFYLYDLKNDTTLATIKMDGYFCHLYFNNDLFYVTSAGSVYCIDKEGHEIWLNSNVGIDGVLINEFVDGKIYGMGEWDPPGGWREFTLDQRSGKSLT
jgi:hypothetical protein